MIRFKHIKALNFRAFSKLDLDLDNQGLVIILGHNKDSQGNASNGASKSSIFYAILYALYGQIPSSSSSDSIINEKVGKDTAVFLDLDIGSDEVRIERYRKDSKNKNKVLLFVNGKELSQPTNKATDSKILALLGVSMGTMLNSIMFGSSNVTDFVSATDKQRKAILEELSNVSIYKKAQEEVKIHKKESSQKLLDVDKELSNINSSKAYYEATESSYKDQIENHKQQLDKAEKEVQELKDTIAKINVPSDSDIAKVSSELDSLEAKGKSIKLKDTSSVQKDVNDKLSSLNQITYRMSDLLASVKSDNEELVRLKNSADSICRLCGNVLDKEHKEKEKDRLSNNLHKNMETLLSLKKNKQDSENELKKAKDKLSSIQEANSKINDSQNVLREQYKKLYSKYKDMLSNKSNYVSAKSSLEKGMSYIQKLKLEKIERPSILDEKLPESSSLLKEKDKLEKEVDEYEELFKIFGDKGVKAHVLGLAIPFINEKMQEYMQVLSNGTLNAFISKELNANGEKTERMGISVSSATAANDYNDLSSGEKKRVAIALNLAFLTYLSSKVGGLNLSVFDEIFDSLDEPGIEAVVSLLKNIAKQVGSVYVISHNDDLKYNDNFDKVLLVEKKDGLSHVKEGEEE